MDETNQYRYILENTLGIPFTEYNSVDILVNGDEIFPAMLKAIRHAKRYINFLTFVYWSGQVAEDFAEAFAQKAREGLRVRVLLDSYGAAAIPSELINKMEVNGVQVHWFRPLSGWKVWEVDNRSHRKILVCDGNIGFTGGVGIAEEWEGDARNPSEYRDTHFRIRGRAVRGLQAAFMENWIETEDFLSLSPDWQKDVPDRSDEYDSTLIQTIRTSESTRWSDLVMLYQTLIKMAQKTIYIGTAYFNPDNIMISLLNEAAGRGVDVSIIMPGKYSDEQLAVIAGEEAFEELLNGGVHLWYYQKTMYHTKKIIIDGIVSCIGSANFNHRSMLKDDEFNLICINEKLARKLTKNFKQDLTYSEPVDKKRWEKRSLFRRGIEKIVTLGRNQI